jgi:hypothetical protein
MRLSIGTSAILYRCPSYRPHASRDIFQQMKDYGKCLCDLVMPENSLVREAVRAALMVSPEMVHFRILGPSSFQSLRWELLRFDEDSNPFAVIATFTRGESKGISRYTSNRNVTIERLNVLLVTARTRGKSDIDYRTISRALVEFIGDRQSTRYLHILRPGTLMALQKELASEGPWVLSHHTFRCAWNGSRWSHVCEIAPVPRVRVHRNHVTC